MNQSIPVVIIGAGPIGLTAALDLQAHGIPAIILDAKTFVPPNQNASARGGSRAICFSKRSLEIWDRLNAVTDIRAKGVTWNTGRVYYKNKALYHFNLLPEAGHKHPAFVNLQQYYLEEYLLSAYEQRSPPEQHVRWQHRVTQVRQTEHGATVEVEAPDSRYQIHCQYVLACDGAHSPTRKQMGLDFGGMLFEERFLITDVKMKAPFPAERWFWFDPPFHNGNALLHMQPDNVWRIDLQLGPEADINEEKKPERVIPRIRAMLGPQVDFDLEWVSIYTFHSRRMAQFVHGRVIFAGDSAHLVSPFGARGANSGVQDVDNLVWKLALILNGHAPASLLDSYNNERTLAAAQNLFFTESSTEFIAPNSPAKRALRDAVLELAQDYAFARPLINSGRLSTPTSYPNSPLNTPDDGTFTRAKVNLGDPASDVPITSRNGGEHTPDGQFLTQLGGKFDVVFYGNDAATSDDWQTPLPPVGMPLRVHHIAPAHTSAPVLPPSVNGLHDHTGDWARRYDAQPGSVYLFRPDQHLCARWRHYHPADLQHALAHAVGRSGKGQS